MTDDELKCITEVEGVGRDQWERLNEKHRHDV